jgi:hypothetical protein
LPELIRKSAKPYQCSGLSACVAAATVNGRFTNRKLPHDSLTGVPAKGHEQPRFLRQANVRQ